MTKTITANIGGCFFTIDEDAYRLLETYLKNLSKHFAKEENGAEIIDDMEHRIGELLSERIESPNQVVIVRDVEEIIRQMGQPEDFQEEESTSSNEGYHSTHTNENTQNGPRRLFRNPDDKVLGGVLSGVAAYYGWDPTLVRMAVVLLCLLGVHIGVGGLLLVYLVAWFLIPEAKDAADRLAMHGKKVDISSIGKTVTDGFEQATRYAQSEQVRSGLQRFCDGVISIAGVCAKILLVVLALSFVPVILALVLVCFALITVGFGAAAALPAFLPVLLTENFPGVQWENLPSIEVGWLWALVICGMVLVSFPIFALIHTISHHFGKAKPLSTLTRCLLILGWIAAAVCIGVVLSGL